MNSTPKSSQGPTVLIINPRAGGGHARERLAQVHDLVSKRLGPCEMMQTQHAGHARALAEAATRAGASLIIAAGGDGTASECADGMARAARSDVALGLIGLGTGGDFARGLGFEHRLDRYVDVLATGARIGCDLGAVEWTTGSETGRTHFINVLSLGLGGLVDEFVASASRRFGSKLAYFGASARALAASEPLRLKVEVSRAGETETRQLQTYMFALCNGRYFGSGMHIAPMAEVTDGQFECVALGSKKTGADSQGKLAFALRSLAIYQGKHIADPTTHHFPADSIVVEREDGASIPLDIDGEPRRAERLTVTVKPSALTLITQRLVQKAV
jgi:diacylglycerol kinase (ATP)